jgi:hypothetical protein
MEYNGGDMVTDLPREEIIKLIQEIEFAKKEVVEQPTLNNLDFMVELDGIEPTTSGLQSPRSPN